ncbi:hypothetical protein MKZ38_004856 [Zalerion maritima]|uniref:Heterokaryon incompatibility domain-containing protein n=1 Tax=Zalerion maritima TaxID=339359 RepID=A0AAD5WPL7_9PEZI|nr:hypothetical protein MKZ38_004856 [Zalerion maritima]
MDLRPLEYRELHGCEIRLFRLIVLDGADLVCELRNFELGKHPKYLALSYVWGDPSQTRPIIVNGQMFCATANLHDALYKLRNMQKESGELWMWADAICVNQVDMAEKSKQVPRMGDIYRSCERVVAWLGYPPEDKAACINLFLEKATKVWALTAGSDDNYTYHTAEGTMDLYQDYGLDAEDCLRGFGYLAAFPWWERMWVVQECVIHEKEPMLLIGNYTIRRLADIVRMPEGFLDLASEAISDPQPWPTEMAALGIIQSREMYHELGTMDDTATKLNYFITGIGGTRKATQAHDMIYGLLGLTNTTGLPSELAPSYETPFPQVYQAYAKYIMEQSGSMETLHREEYHLGEYGAPSWVPDLRFPHGRKIMGVNSGLKKSGLAFSKDGCRLLSKSDFAGNVIAQFSFPGHFLDRDDDKNISANLSRLEEVIVRKAASMRNTCIKTFRDELSRMIIGWLGYGGEMFLGTQELLLDPRDGRPSPPSLPDDQNYPDGEFWKRLNVIRGALWNYTCFVLENGCVGCYRTAARVAPVNSTASKEGVYWIVAAGEPFILQQVGGGCSKFVACCHLEVQGARNPEVDIVIV